MSVRFSAEDNRAMHAAQRRKPWTRRRLMKLAGWTAIAAVAAPLTTRRSYMLAQGYSPIPPPEPLGRVTYDFLNIRASPSTTSGQTGQLLRDNVIPLYEQVIGETVTNNDNLVSH
jgi:hypothetical protein